MEVVPSEDTLVVEASVRVDDIDAVHPGLPVQVRLSAYSFRSTPPLDGTLVEISADRVVDPRTGTATYPARAVLSQKGHGAAPHIRLHPGMSAEVVIVKGRRTLLDYLLDPILRATDRAFIES
jgi:HlyD family secretion protein/epimerase transport system membrane fusion protein